MIHCEVLESDVLVVGAGAAGIHAAIKAHEEGVNVLMVNSGIRGKDSAVTWMAGGGFQCVLYPPDSLEVHVRDTIKNGRYLSDQELVYAMLKEAPGCIEDLESWGEKYPYAVQSWRKNWDLLSTFFKYPAEIRRLIYTTNPIESYNNGVKRITKTKTCFGSEDSLLKLIYLVTQDIVNKWENPISNWGLIYNQIMIFFKERIS